MESQLNKARRPTASTTIHRQRVVSRIQRAARFRVVLLIAGAGYGKSEALTQYWTRVRGAKVICRVPKTARTLPAFVHAFAEACATIAPGMASSAASALSASHDVAEPLEALVTWAGAHLREFRGVIALEDFENANTGDSRVTRFVDRLVSEYPAIRWVIAARHPGLLPVSKWVAQELCDLPVDPRDLSFTADEALALARRIGSELDEEAVRNSVERLAGWPFALAIEFRSAARTHASSDDGGRRILTQYLATQVWEALPSDEQQFCELASAMPNLSVQLAIRAGFDGAVRIARSIANKLPFASFDGDRFTMHDLFRSFVTEQIVLRGHKAYNELLMKSVHALAEEGSLGEALDLAMQTGDPANVRAFIDRRELALCNLRHRDVLKRALRMLATDNSESITFLKMISACDDAALRAAYDLGQQLLQMADLRPDFVKPTILVVLRCVSLVGVDTIAASKSQLVLCALQGDRGVIAVREAVRVWSEASHGDAARTLRQIRKIEPMLLLVDPLDRALVLHALAGACVWSEQLDLADRFAEEALASAIEAGDGVLAARAAANRVVALANNPFSLRGLEEAVDRARYVCARGGLWPILGAAFQAYANALVWSGRTEEAGVVVEELRRQPKPLGVEFDQPVDFLRGCLRALSGDLVGSRRILSRVAADLLRRDDLLTRAHAASTLVVLAIVAGLNGNLQIADQALRHYDELDSTKKRHPCLQHGLVIALLGLGRFTLASRVARKVAGQGSDAAVLDRSYHLLMRDRDSPIVSADLERHRRSPGVGFLVQLLERMMETWRCEQKDPHELTPSELAILEMLKLDLSNKEIAIARSSSEATVKVHVGAIMRKLGAESRRAAVVIARSRGVLDSLDLKR